MFKINRKIEYALIALKHMSLKDPGQLTSAKEICSLYNTPFDPTSRVMQIMTQKGVLKAEQGAHGGYQITEDLSKLTMFELTEMLTGEIKIANCFHGNYSHCDLTASCTVIAPMLNLNERLEDMFKQVVVKDLLESKNQAEKLIRDQALQMTHKTA